MTLQLFIVALIAGLAAPLSGVITVLILGRQNRQTTQQNWRREDLVAARAAEAAQALIESNKVVAEAAEENAAKTFSQLTQIHTLVNSNMTAAMEDALASKLGHLVALEQVLVMQRDTDEPVTDTLREIQKTKEDIARRRVELQDRLRQTKIAEAQIEQAEGGGIQAEWQEEVDQ
jgi:hypothetical protein